MITMYRTGAEGIVVSTFDVISFNKGYYVLLRNGREKSHKRVTVRDVIHETELEAINYLLAKAKASELLYKDRADQLTRMQRLAG